MIQLFDVYITFASWQALYPIGLILILYGLTEWMNEWKDGQTDKRTNGVNKESWFDSWQRLEIFFTSNCQYQIRGPPNPFFSRNQNSHPASQGIGPTTHLNPLLRFQLGWASLPFYVLLWHADGQLFTITPKTLLHFERIHQIIPHFFTYFQQLTKNPLLGCFLSAHISEWAEYFKYCKLNDKTTETDIIYLHISITQEATWKDIKSQVMFWQSIHYKLN